MLRMELYILAASGTVVGPAPVRVKAVKAKAKMEIMLKFLMSLYGVLADLNKMIDRVVNLKVDIVSFVD